MNRVAHWTPTMTSIEWSTDGDAGGERCALYREEVLPSRGLAAELDPAAVGPFQAKMAHRSKGLPRHVKAEADAHRVMRRPREIARQEGHGYSIYREIGDGCWFRYGGSEFVTKFGDLVITDADAPW